jgi:hypothetical protein
MKQDESRQDDNTTKNTTTRSGAQPYYIISRLDELENGMGARELKALFLSTDLKKSCAPELTPNVCGDVEFLYVPTAVYKYMNRKIEELE